MASAAALAMQGVSVHAVAARIESDPLPGVTLHHAPDLFREQLSPAQRLGEARELRPSVIHLHQFDDPQVLASMQQIAPVVASVHGYVACTSGVHYFRPGQECTRAHGPGCVPNLALRGCAHTRDPRTLPPATSAQRAACRRCKRADLAISYSSTIDRHLAANGVTRRTIVPLFATMQPASARRSRRAAARRLRRTRRDPQGGRRADPRRMQRRRRVRHLRRRLAARGDAQARPQARRARARALHRLAGAGELARELAEASVVAMPSLWPEPFGLVGIEAHAAGRPVVASATGGVCDWLQDGVSGLFVKPGDVRALAAALSELLADPARQQAMGEAGRALVAARFTPERHVAALARGLSDGPLELGVRA